MFFFSLLKDPVFVVLGFHVLFNWLLVSIPLIVFHTSHISDLLNLWMHLKILNILIGLAIDFIYLLVQVFNSRVIILMTLLWGFTRWFWSQILLIFRLFEMSFSLIQIHIDIGIFCILCAMLVFCNLDCLGWTFSRNISVLSLIPYQAWVIICIWRRLSGSCTFSKIEKIVFIECIQRLNFIILNDLWIRSTYRCTHLRTFFIETV